MPHDHAGSKRYVKTAYQLMEEQTIGNPNPAKLSDLLREKLIKTDLIEMIKIILKDTTTLNIVSKISQIIELGDSFKQSIE